jgi:hypothetical protein
MGWIIFCPAGRRSFLNNLFNGDAIISQKSNRFAADRGVCLQNYRGIRRLFFDLAGLFDNRQGIFHDDSAFAVDDQDEFF